MEHFQFLHKNSSLSVEELIILIEALKYGISQKEQELCINYLISIYNVPKMSLNLKFFMNKKEKSIIKELIDSLEGLDSDKVK